MAEGLLNVMGSGKYMASSAGTTPSKVHPLAIYVMKEIGIDISHHRSKSIEEFKGEKFDIVVTVCDNAKEACPFFPYAKKYLHRSFEDPSQLPEARQLAAFRKVRDEIKKWILNTFLKEESDGA